MYTIKTILAHPSNVQLRIMREVIRAQNLKIDLLEEAADMDSLYEGILRHAPDLVILPDTMFSACINVITDKTDVVCITENRSLTNAGTIRYAYVPVQPPELIQIVQSIYPNIEEEKMNACYEARRAFLQSLHLPQEYCAAIDIYVQEQKQLNRNHSKSSLFLQRREIIEKIQNGEFPLERVKERFQSRRFEPSSTFDPYAMRFVEDLGEIVPTQKVLQEPDVLPQNDIKKPKLAELAATEADTQRSSQVLTSTTHSSIVGFEKEETEGHPVYIPPQHKTVTHIVSNVSSTPTPESQGQPQRKKKQGVGKIVWKKHPSKLVYRRGEPIDFHDGVITVYRTDGTSYECNITEDMIRQAETKTTGKKFVTLMVRNGRFSEQISVLDVALDRLIMSSVGRKTYSPGEKFDPEGYAFSAVFSDGTTEPISRYKYQRNSINDSQAFVMVTYGTVSYPVPITVLTRTLQSIEWVSKPKKTDYGKGEPFDLTGGVFAAIFRDGTREEIPVTMQMLNRTSTRQYGPRRILVNYQGMTLSFDITVHPKDENPTQPVQYEVKELSPKPIFLPIPNPIAEPEQHTQEELNVMTEKAEKTNNRNVIVDGTEATKEEKRESSVHKKHLEFLRDPKHFYATGERVQKSDILVKLVDEDGNFELIDEFTMEPDRPLTNEDNVLRIRYQDLELNLDLQVVSRKVLAVVVKSMPKKLEYIKGETELDLDGGVLAVFYSDATNDSIPITPSMIESFDGKTVGQQIVYINYQGQKVPIPVIVRDRVMVKVEVVEPPQKLKYRDGETLDITGLSLAAIYDNGDREFITDYDAPKVRVAYGQAVVQMSYHGLPFPIFIHVDKSEIIGIRIDKKPDKLVYLENREILDITGGRVVKILNNGEEEIVPMEPHMVSGFSNQRVGSCRIFVTIDTFQTSFEVQIKGKEAAEIQVVRRPNKVLYFEKEPFDPTGMELKVRYDNNTFEMVHEYTFEPKIIERDTNEVTVTFQHVSTTIPVQVQVRNVEAISVAKMPEKIQFKEGVEQIDTRGGKLLVLYNNESAETIDMHDNMICGFDNTVPGFSDVTVLYENKETKYQIEIIPKVLIGIAVQTFPQKTVYQESDIFDPTGMVLMGYYDNGSSGALEHFAINPDGPLAVGTSAVMLSYADKMTIVPIQVTEKVQFHADVQDPLQFAHRIETTPEPVTESVSGPAQTQSVIEPILSKPVPQIMSGPAATELVQEHAQQLEELEIREKKEASIFYASSDSLRFKDDAQNASLFF